MTDGCLFLCVLRLNTFILNPELEGKKERKKERLDYQILVWNKRSFHKDVKKNAVRKDMKYSKSSLGGFLSEQEFTMIYMMIYIFTHTCVFLYAVLS